MIEKIFILFILIKSIILFSGEISLLKYNYKNVYIRKFDYKYFLYEKLFDNDLTGNWNKKITVENNKIINNYIYENSIKKYFIQSYFDNNNNLVKLNIISNYSTNIINFIYKNNTLVELKYKKRNNNIIEKLYYYTNTVNNNTKNFVENIYSKYKKKAEKNIIQNNIIKEYEKRFSANVKFNVFDKIHLRKTEYYENKLLLNTKIYYYNKNFLTILEFNISGFINKLIMYKFYDYYNYEIKIKVFNNKDDIIIFNKDKIKLPEICDAEKFSNIRYNDFKNYDKKIIMIFNNKSMKIIQKIKNNNYYTIKYYKNNFLLKDIVYYQTNKIIIKKYDKISKNIINIKIYRNNLLSEEYINQNNRNIKKVIYKYFSNKKIFTKHIYIKGKLAEIITG